MARPKKIKDENTDTTFSNDYVIVEALGTLAGVGYAYFAGDVFEINKEKAEELFEKKLIKFR